MKPSPLLLIISVLAAMSIKGQDVEFIREEITFGLDTVFFSVDGDYYFRNTTGHPVDQTFFYPYANADKGMTVDSALVFDITDNAFIKPGSGRKDGIFFRLAFTAHEKKEVKVYYRQHHDRHSATYILTTTAYWKKPLETANYSLITDQGTILVDSVSYPPDNTFTAGNNKIYEWKKKDFMPEKDFTVWFRVVTER
jgi:hypothetical protein